MSSAKDMVTLEMDRFWTLSGRSVNTQLKPGRSYDSARIIQRLRNHITDDHLNDISIVYLGLLSPLR